MKVRRITGPVAAILACISVGAAYARVVQVVPGKGCERVRTTRVSGPVAATLTVRATGRDCAHAWIVTTLRSAKGAPLWRERYFLGAVENDRLPGEPAPPVAFEHVIAVVEHWASTENTAEAPLWPAGAPRLSSRRDGAQVATRLPRGRYERIRAAAEPMLCLPVGSETGHCLAVDPASAKWVELLVRGV